MNKNHKAVVLGANYYVGLSIIRCLGREGIYVTAVDYQKQGAYALKSKYVSEILIGPHYSKEAEQFKDFLIDYAKKQNYKPVLFPSADEYAEFMDTYLLELSEHYFINMTEKGLWSDLINKNSFYQLAEKHGVRHPKTFSDKEDLLVEKVKNEIGFPCLIKPTDSMNFVKTFRKKLFKVESVDELVEGLNLAQNEGLEVVVQQMIQGFDNQMFTYDTYLNQDSKVTHWMTAQKIRQYPINFGASAYIVQRYVPELHEIGGRFLEEVGYKGFGEIEFKMDSKTGDFYVIEMNARATNFNPMIEALGLNMPLITYKELTGQEIGEKAITEDTGQAFKYLYEDIFAIRAYVKSGQLTREEARRKVHKNITGALWAPDDIKPAVSFINTKIVKRSWNKILGSRGKGNKK